MSDIQFKEKFVAFIDVLGFKKMVQAAEAGTGMPLDKLLEILKTLGSPEERGRIGKHGPTICPKTQYLQRDLDFRVTQVSDCAVISAEISPAGVVNLACFCWGIVMGLLRSGIMCRGYITRGRVFHTDQQVIGSGYQRAFENEKNVTAFKREADERGTPFVEVDRTVCNYVKQSEDWCTKEMFSRFVKNDGVVVALFPFKKLAHSFIVAGWGHKCDPEEEKRNVQNMRVIIGQIKERVLGCVDPSNTDATKKAQHYILALDAQLAVCDQTDSFLKALASLFPSGR
jgi:hypothetical protein